MTPAPHGFLGTGWAFPPAFSRDRGGATLVDGWEDIRQALRILLTTYPGERVMRPDFGLDPGVFSLIDETSVSDLKARILAAIQRFEPRIRVLSISASLDEAEGRVSVLVDYEIPEVNARGNLTVPFYLPEAAE
ncbi:MAG: GPW/gp25 family protein [Pseudomonadota bacterium]